MMDLSLITTKNLINEIFKRTDGCAIVFCQTDSGNIPNIKTHWSEECTWIELVGMVDVLKYQLLQTYDEQESDLG